MSIKNFTIKSFIFASLALFFISCSDNEEETNGFDTSIVGGYVLNSGSWGQNNSTLSYYDTDNATLTSSVFETQNDGLNLGDTGEDILIYGNKMYISVSTSGIIYITDKTGKEISSIIYNPNGTALNPRHFASSGGYVYASYYGGYVARIDTTTNAIDKQVAVGSYPEEIAVSGENLYVTNSRTDSTISVIDLTTFTKTEDITVVLNPTVIRADGNGNLFVISMGNYGTILNTLQRIYSDNTVETIGNGTLIALNPAKTKLYNIYAQYGASNIYYTVYDISSKSIETSPFVSSTTASGFAADPYSISVNPKDGNVFIGVSDYSSESSMYIVDPSTGDLASSFTTGGINPVGIYFLSE
ncbi:MAG: hypothetical protein H6Q14_2904 [Bacteroidetes bacterium]|jgi:hypothetical protein|nr:hypothetical protein [Bacteroidota bacterium]